MIATTQYEEAYKAAEEQDKILELALQNRPIKDNPWFWIKYCRTLKTTLDLIEQRATDIIREGQPYYHESISQTNL